MFKRAMTTAIALAAALFITACHTPKGGLMPFTGGSNTYFSYETRPVTITILDLRTNEQIFTMNVPPGKQLTFDFKEGEGDDPVYNPDIMRYEVFDIGTDTGKLRSTLSVPPANARRIDVSYRDEYEYRTAQKNNQIRPEQVVNQPYLQSPQDIWSTRDRVTGVDPARER